MARSCPHQPPVPSPAERARTTAVRASGAALIAGPGTTEHADGDDGGRVTPVLHHVPASGAATLQLPADHPLVVRTRAQEYLPVMLELTDTAPLPVRQPVRGLVWIAGRVRVLPARVARRAALRIAAETADERLLDVGHSDVLLRLDPGSVVLSDAEGTGTFTPAEVAAGAPDPFVATGDAWLSHLAHAHASLLAGLARHLPPALRRPENTLVPLAVDRLGLRLRVETDRGDHDVRIGFSAPVACPRLLGAEVRRLAEVSPAATGAVQRRAAER
ncbi:DUF2470 domain-containing protein [Actinomycetospora sp. TBRC 11914]|uniref:DUF2470 domain-containing protein n=1 Tax=Actinomycetospora sp. TBRC 11914 TaxID=2729387 RepID=UPI00145ECBED|nr:DUF2470 domain-containing protein [Actinomycetospora sp. TBRC 11914]NMO90115.1 DUF2470 domain-containing protein [Actinomycetospora sp. TBRC 11914]